MHAGAWEHRARADSDQAASARGGQGRTLLQIVKAHGANSLLFDAIQHNILFHARYKIIDTTRSAHKSATSTIVFAESYEFARGSEDALVTSVALKFFSTCADFEKNLKATRRERKLDGRFVLGVLQTHSSRQTSEEAFSYATAIRKFKGGVYQDYP